ncbi:MAG: hypothetical protein Q9169_000529 [Polycauliona sp. 2 TL-2023]
MLDLWYTSRPKKFERRLKKAGNARVSRLRGVKERSPYPRSTTIFRGVESSIMAGEDGRERALTIDAMQSHIMSLTPSIVLAQWNDVVELRNMRERADVSKQDAEADAAKADASEQDASGQNAAKQDASKPSTAPIKPLLYSHMFILDRLFFRGNLERWITLEWDDTMVGRTGYTMIWPNVPYARMRICPTKLPDGGYDRDDILETLLHEMLHVVERLPGNAGRTDPLTQVHQMGFSGHGPMWRAMAAKIESLANGLLYRKSRPWDMGIHTGHIGELTAVAKINPSRFGNCSNLNFDLIHGWTEPASGIIDVERRWFNITVQWKRNGYIPCRGHPEDEPCLLEN